MTPAEAALWVEQAGRQLDAYYVAWALACCYRAGEYCDALSSAREELVLARANQGHWGRRLRRIRLLLIFVRRLTPHVEGYTAPACGWCSDTGVEYHRRRPDVWPVACHACRPVEHGEQMRFRQEAHRSRRRARG